MMNGSRSLEGFVPTRDATVVTRLLDAGVTVAGKAVCEDLCFSGSSFTPATGPVRNPWNPDREAVDPPAAAPLSSLAALSISLSAATRVGRFAFRPHSVA